MQRLINQMKKHGAMAANTNIRTRMGLVSSYDPDNYCCKVRIQPEDFETGWLPIASPWVGAQWGMFAPPCINDMVDVHYEDGDPDAGFVSQGFYNDVERPVHAESGIFYLIHRSGSALKFNNDGSVDVISHTDLRATVGGNLTVSVAGKADITTGTKTTITASEVDIKCNLVVTGDIVASGNIGDASGTKTMAGMRSTFNAHTHQENGTGGGITNPTATGM